MMIEELGNKSHEYEDEGPNARPIDRDPNLDGIMASQTRLHSPVTPAETAAQASSTTGVSNSSVERIPTFEELWEEFVKGSARPEMYDSSHKAAAAMGYTWAIRSCKGPQGLPRAAENFFRPRPVTKEVKHAPPEVD
jgi:hypothetical protein